MKHFWKFLIIFAALFCSAQAYGEMDGDYYVYEERPIPYPEVLPEVVVEGEGHSTLDPPSLDVDDPLCIDLDELHQEMQDLMDWLDNLPYRDNGDHGDHGDSDSPFDPYDNEDIDPQGDFENGLDNDYWDEYWSDFENDQEPPGCTSCGSNGNNGNNTEAALIAQREAAAQSLAAELYARMQTVYGNGVAPFPPVHYKHNYEGTALAYYKDGAIYATQGFFNSVQAVQFSTLTHERTHWEHDRDGINPIAKNENGNPLSVETGLTCADVMGAEELANITSVCAEDAPSFNDPQAWTEGCIEVRLSEEYTYAGSNHYQEEVDARQAELQAEADGLTQ